MTVHETVQETVQDTVQTVQDTVQSVQETVQETVQTTAERAADVLAATADRTADALEETADRLRAHAPDSGRHFPWRPLLLTAGIAGAALAVAQALRMARARSAGQDGFPGDMPGGIDADDAQARIDRSVESAQQAVTDITDNARSTSIDSG